MKRLNPFIIVLLICFSNTALAKGDLTSRILPMPPSENPHPPKTKKDINRVIFAEAVIKSLLKAPYPKTSKENLTPWLTKKGLAFNLDRNCIEKKLCWSAKNDVSKYIQAIHEDLEQLEEMQFTHVIPWSLDAFENKNKEPDTVPTGSKMPASFREIGDTELSEDEYMIHTYAKFKGVWHHLNVIVTEDQKGNLLFRRFFIVRMPESGKMPEGSIC